MKMTAGRRALDKIYKRRDRYDIPEWQRGKVWDTDRKQQLIDSILRGWKLPKFYFVKLDDDNFEVVDGQQRLAAIYAFCDNELALSAETEKEFGGPYYKDLKLRITDTFDDFEIEYDEIQGATEEELKDFFQRLQRGLPLTSSEKLNSVHSKLRDFCTSLVKYPFFTHSITVPNTRFAHLDVASKVAAIEVEGTNSGLRFQDIKKVFEGQKTFSSTSEVAERIKSALDFLATAFPGKESALKNRTVAQSVVTFACKLVEAGRAGGLEHTMAQFIRRFLGELAHQVELGHAATDYDYTRFQKSINANVKGGARIRHEILLRKAFMHNPHVADAFDPSALLASGITGRIKELGENIAEQVSRINSAYLAIHGEDLFKPTNRTTQALRNIGKPIKHLRDYTNLISDLYFLFGESVGQRLGTNVLQSFADVHILRTDLQHDIDQGDRGKIRRQRKRIGSTFERYSAVKWPQLLDASRFVLVQANLLSAIELDLKNLPVA
jgi:hypothetical protein